MNAVSQQNSEDAQVLLMALRRTLEFEAELDETFGNGASSSSSFGVNNTNDTKNNNSNDNAHE